MALALWTFTAACGEGAHPPGQADGVSEGFGITSAYAGVDALGDAESISPLLDFLGGGFATADHRLAEEERLVATCMGDLGWLYYPIDPTADVQNEPRTVGARLEWRRQYGFGLAIAPGPGTQLQDTLNANSAVWDGLSAEERVAYLHDLDGGVSETDSPDPESCRGRAQATTGAPIRDSGVLRIVSQEIAAIESNPELVAQRRAWVACMLERGFDYSAEGLMVVQLSAAMADSPSVDEFLALEVAAAVADLECARVTIWPVQVRLETEIVQRIVDEFPEYARLGQ
ncbi:MAG: hypothetical protein QY307_04195 [Acidimicrobiia bacterium]|nr:MAG: hypothetical protein QY307_04195 [Acidimicrobiia bacterium]